MATIAELKVKIGANVTDFDKKLSGIQAKMKATGKKMQQVGKSMSMAITAPLALIGAAAIKMGADFDKSLTKINTLVGISKEKIIGFEKDIQQISSATAKSQNELVKALFTVTSAGLRGAKATNVLEMSAKASAVGLGETKDVAQALTGILQSYSKQGLTAAKATDILVATVRAGNLEASDLAPVLGRVTGLASQLGVGFEEVGASLATFTRLGVNSEEAVTGLRGVLSTLLKPTTQAEEALNAVGLTSAGLRDSLSKKGLQKTLADLMIAFKGNDELLGQVIPNVRALGAVLGTAGAQGDEYAKIVEEITNSQGLLNETFEETAKSASFKMEQAFVTMKDAMTEFGKMAVTMLAPFFEKVSAILNKFKDLEPGTKKIIILIAGLAAAIGPLLVMLGFLISTILPALVTGFAALIGPIGLTVAAIAALGVISYAVYDHLTRVQTAQEALNDTMDDAKKAVSGELGELRKLVLVAKNEKLSREKRQAAIDELQKKYPNYLKNLQLENINSQETAGAVNKLAVALIKRAQARAIEAKMQDIAAKQAEAELTNGESALTMLDNIQLFLTKGRRTAREYELQQKRLGETTKASAEQLELLGNKLAKLDAEEQAIIGPTTDLGNELKKTGKKGTEAFDDARMAFNQFANELREGSELPTLDNLTKKASAFGDELLFAQTHARELSMAFDETPVQHMERQRTVLKQFIDEATSGGMAVTSAVQQMIEQYKKLGDEIDNTGEKTKLTAEQMVAKIGDVLSQIASAVGQIAGQVTSIINQNFQARQIALDNYYTSEKEKIDGAGMSETAHANAMELLDQKVADKKAQMAKKKAKADKKAALVGAMVNTAAAVAGALTMLPPPVGIAFAAIVGSLGAMQIAAINATPLPSFAQGGIVSAPMIAQIGDAPSGPEVVAPLSKLQSMLGGGMELKTIIRGEDIILVTDRTKANRDFIT